MLLACLLAAVAVWPAAPAAAAKDKGEGIGQKIEKERRNLEKIRAEIEAKKRRAEEADRKKESVLQGIQELDNHLQTARGQHREVARQLQKKDEELDAINAEVAIVRLRVAERRASILTRLRVQYMEGRFGYFKALLSADSYEALQRRYQYLSAVSKREYDLMNAYRSDLLTLQQVEQQAAAARDEMLAYKDQTERKLNEIHGLKQQ
jgi:septal ring factor EnvC (AmiA/AmiB activator)